MIVDTSAIVAILMQEPEASDLAALLAESSSTGMSAPTLVELQALLEHRRDARLKHRADALLREARIDIMAFTSEHARLARVAYRDYGKASGHPARLNLADCFSYALATATGRPLLFVGNDFVHTDVRSALRSRPPSGPGAV